MLTPRQRTLASIHRNKLDAIPWQFDLTHIATEKLCAYYKTRDLLQATGDHFVCTGYGPPTRYVEQSPGPGFVRSEFGVVTRHEARDINVGDWGEIVSCPLHEPSLKGFEFPDGAASGRWNHIPDFRAKYPDHFLMAHGAALFQPAWAMCGFENYLGYIATEPKFVEELTEKLADFSCAVTRGLRGLNVDGIRFGDDWGCQRALMIDAGKWRKMFKPYYRRIYEAAKKEGLVVMIHSCGNITELVPDFIEIGVEVIHAFQPEAMDVQYCQREFGKHVTFWGGLGSQSTIPLGTPEDCRNEVRDRLRLFKNGGYVLAPAGAIPTEAPVENLVAIIEEAQAQLAR